MKLAQGEIDDRAIRAAMSSRAELSTAAMRRTFRGPWPRLVANVNAYLTTAEFVLRSSGGALRRFRWLLARSMPGVAT